MVYFKNNIKCLFRYEMADAFRKFNDTISKKRKDNRQTPITPLETNSNNAFYGGKHNFQ